MNKKFFAALASATMAFSATGSLAVFAQDFEEENTPALPTDQEKPAVAKKVVWNKDNFGDLVDNGLVYFNNKDGSFTEPKLNEEIKVSDLDAVKTIALLANFDGEVKGLEYFTELTGFQADVTAGALKNTSLDFSENTKAKQIVIKHANELSDIVLPNPVKGEDANGKETVTYNLSDLTLDDTALTSIDLSTQKGLKNVTIINGNLNSIKLRDVKHASDAADKTYYTLDLSNNAFETINLDYYTFTVDLNLSGNRFGGLDLSDTTAKKAELNNQKFYVAKDSVSINLLNTFGLSVKDLEKVNAAPKALKLDDDKNYTGDFDLEKASAYSYNTGLMGDAASTLLEVTFEKANPMHRLYNPNSGEHFYTADFEEHDALVALGWNDEGYGWVAPLEPAENLKPTYAVYRLYNANAGDHHYTMDVKERDTLVSYGWKNEGTGWYSAKNMSGTSSIDQTHTALPVYRQYNPYANGAGAHNYTTDKAENDFLVSVGWTPEGTAWYGLK